MPNFKTAKIIPIALVLIIIAVVIAALFSVARSVFFSNNKTADSSKIDTVQDIFLNPNSVDHSVKMIVRGSLVADEKFRSYEIQISPTSRKVTIFKGYLNQPVDNITLTNNIPAYEQFVYALSKANMMKGSELTGDKNDLRGICAGGRVYEFQVLEADKPVKTLWTSSCSNSKGSLSADRSQLSNLFTSQIPDSSKIINKAF